MGRYHLSVIVLLLFLTPIAFFPRIQRLVLTLAAFVYHVGYIDVCSIQKTLLEPKRIFRGTVAALWGNGPGAECEMQGVWHDTYTATQLDHQCT